MSYNVLIVDDSRITRCVVRKSIAMSGVALGEVYEAGNGKEALAVLGAKWVDIVFSDLSMPEMGGLELVERMAADQLLLSIPVVVVSSEQSERLAAELKSRGVRGYVRKPFRPESLREVITEVLGRPQ
ncbi:MAG: response regulator [Deltaproteobacteria bacterium]|nr:response regulator [Deltaproteobacteria bacterium]